MQVGAYYITYACVYVHMYVGNCVLRMNVRAQGWSACHHGLAMCCTCSQRGNNQQGESQSWGAELSMECQLVAGSSGARAQRGAVPAGSILSNALLDFANPKIAIKQRSQTIR